MSENKDLIQRLAKRFRSMVPTCPVPKDGEKCWEVCTEGRGFYVSSLDWSGSPGAVVMYQSGRIFATEEAAQAWIDQYAEAWTTLGDAS